MPDYTFRIRFRLSPSPRLNIPTATWSFEMPGAPERVWLSASKFFTHCYGLRSKMVHGEVPAPSSEDLGNVMQPLGEFVSDLLAGPMPDVNVRDDRPAAGP